jgi:hypothetical protein
MIIDQALQGTFYGNILNFVYSKKVDVMNTVALLKAPYTQIEIFLHVTANS